MMIRSIDELIKEKLVAAKNARQAYALAAADGNARIARRCRNLHAQYLRQIHILWEMSAHRF